MFSEFKILWFGLKGIYIISFFMFFFSKTDLFDLKKHRSTQPPPLEKKTLLRLERDNGLFTQKSAMSLPQKQKNTLFQWHTLN